MKRTLFFLIAACLFVSCGKKQGGIKLDNPYDADTLSTLSYELPTSSTEEVVVPFHRLNNSMIVDVRINGEITKEMVFDTGADLTQITKAEAQYLYDKGVLKNEDVKGFENFGDANGTITKNMIVTLRSVILMGKDCGIEIPNVDACVVDNAMAPLLLGQTAYKSLKYTVDNANNQITFDLKDL